MPGAKHVLGALLGESDRERQNGLYSPCWKSMGSPRLSCLPPVPLIAAYYRRSDRRTHPAMEWFLGTTRGVTPDTTFGWPERHLHRRVLRCQWLDGAANALTRGALPPPYLGCVHLRRKRQQPKKISGRDVRRGSSGTPGAMGKAGRVAT